MSYHFLERKDPLVDVLFQGLDNLRVSRRTLQEYRTLGVVPYYLVQGKALYKESDILKILEDAYKRCKEDMRWV